MAEVPVTRQKTLDDEISIDVPPNDVEVYVRCKSVRYRSTEAGKRVRLACEPAWERVLVVGGDILDELNM